MLTTCGNDAEAYPDDAPSRLREQADRARFPWFQTPNMDRVAIEGRQGVARTVPEGFESGSDVATMTLLGYDPKVYHTGRAPLEAAAQRIPLSPSDWVFRCNLVTVVDGIMKDHSAGGISDAEAQRLRRQAVGLEVVEREPEPVDEVALEQAVVSQDLERSPPALVGELDVDVPCRYPYERGTDRRHEALSRKTLAHN